MKNPLKGWRKILFTILGGAVATFYPDSAPYLLPLIKLYILGQSGVDVAEQLAKLSADKTGK